MAHISSAGLRRVFTRSQKFSDSQNSHALPLVAVNPKNRNGWAGEQRLSVCARDFTKRLTKESIPTTGVKPSNGVLARCSMVEKPFRDARGS